MKSINVSAPGKIHLLGEHSIVYGKPAILAAVDKRCFVEITPRKDKVIEIISKDLKVSKKTDEKVILKKIKQAKKIWIVFSKSHKYSLLKTITKDPLDYLLIVIGEALAFYNTSLKTGFTLIVHSEIPVGSGMGSSSALAVSLVGAITVFVGEKFDKEKINRIAFLAEHYIHGFPSGGDTSASCFGGFIWFRKETDSLKILQPIDISLSEKIANKFALLDTGKPKESTGEMVAEVKAFVKKRKKYAEKIFADQELLTRNLLTALQENDEDEIISAIKDGEKNLEKIGVVPPFVKKIIRQIEKSGGAAKICGGGGKTKGTGVLLVYSNKKSQDYAKIHLGEEGVKIHE